MHPPLIKRRCILKPSLVSAAPEKKTLGCKLLIQFKNRTEQCIPLKDSKDSKPVEVAEFASERGIKSKPDFVFWLPLSLRKRDNIIAAVIARTKRLYHKYGVQLPSTVQEAYDLD